MTNFVDLNKVQYRGYTLKPDGSRVWFDNLILSGTLEEAEGELAARLEMTLKNIKKDGLWMHSHVALGSMVFLQATIGDGWKEVFRGRVYRWETTPDNNYLVSITAYDNLYPLQQSKDHKYFGAGETPVSCLKFFAQRWGIPLGRIDGPHTKLAKKRYSATRIGDIIMDRYEEARKKGSGRYVVRSTEGKVESVKEGSNSTVYILEQEHVEDGSADEWSIENLITRVKIYGNEDKEGRAPVVATKDGRTEFGILQDIIYQSSYKNLSEAKKAADEILKENGSPKVTRRIPSVDVPFVRKGDKIKVLAGTISKMGTGGRTEPVDCIVTSVVHDIVNLRMTLSLR